MAIINKIILNYLQIQNKERDLDDLRTKNEALEAQIREFQEKYKKEQEDLQVSVDSGAGCAPRHTRVSHEHKPWLSWMQTQSHNNGLGNCTALLIGSDWVPAAGTENHQGENCTAPAWLPRPPEHEDGSGDWDNNLQVKE